jgi:hypothetical protein
MSKKQFAFFLLIIDLLFLALFLLLSYHNRLASDDFEFLRALKEYGITGAVSYFYHNWNARWPAILLAEIVLSLSEKTPFALFLYGLATLALAVTSFFFLLRNLTKLANLSINNYWVLLYSILLTANFFFLTPGISDTWFWLTTSLMYLWGTLIFLLGFSLTLTERSTFAGNLFIALCFLYCGSANEPLAISVVALLVTFYFLYGAGLSKVRKYKLLLAVFFTSASFLILISSPGITIRRSFLPESQLNVSLLAIFFKSLARYFFIVLPPVLIKGLSFSFLWIFAGMQLKKKLNFTPDRIKKAIKTLVLLFLLVLVTSFLPVCYVMSEMGPPRAWTFPALCMTLLLSAGGFTGGLLFPGKFTSKIVLSMSTVCFFILCITGFDQYRITSLYKSKWDERTGILFKMRSENSKASLGLSPLPPSGYLYSAEVSDDTNHFTNRHLQKGLNLKFPVYQKK